MAKELERENSTGGKSASNRRHHFPFRHRHHRGSKNTYARGGNFSRARVLSGGVLGKIKDKVAHMIPCSFTIASMVLGLMALACLEIRLISGATMLVALAMLMDFLDGRFARLLNSASEFGAQLDSLADMISFGLVPAYAMVFGMRNFSAAGAISLGVSGVIFLIAVAVRLARFNCRLKEAPRDYFEGLPCPAAAGVIMLLMDLSQYTSFSFMAKVNPVLYQSGAEFTVAAVALILSMLMVSRVGFYNFKHAHLNVGKLLGMVVAAGLVIYCAALVSPSRYIAIETVLLLGLALYIFIVLMYQIARYFKNHTFDDRRNDHRLGRY